MIIERNEYNNGYGCSCCRHDWDGVNWIEEKDAQSLEDMIDYVYDKKWYDRDLCHLERLYEKDGKVMYGFHIDYYKAREDVYIIMGKNKYQVYLDYDSSSHTHGKTKEQMLKIAEAFNEV